MRPSQRLCPWRQVTVFYEAFVKSVLKWRRSLPILAMWAETACPDPRSLSDRRPVRGCHFSEKRPLTVGFGLHIWRFTDGAGSLPNPVAPLSTASRYPGPSGMERRRLFDIVGLDEGTCGRRPRSPRSSRPRRIGKAKSFHVSLHIHSNM
jgi:hypothetical protein